MFADADYFIDLMGGAAEQAQERQDQAFRKGKQLHEQGTYLRIAAPVVYELYYGVGFVDNPEKERRKVQNAIMAHPVVELDEQAAMKAGRMLGEIEHNLGQPNASAISQTDICVGSLASIAEEPVLTRNIADYQRMNGVTIESY